MRLTLELDGLALLYALLATAIGLIVLAYSLRYLPRHLAHTDAPQSRSPRLYVWLVIFMASMVGLALAQDLLLLFVFWDLTAIASYFLVAFDREDREARRAALSAMLVTGASAVLLLLGAVMLWAKYGTFSLPELFEVADDRQHLRRRCHRADRRIGARQVRAGPVPLLAAARDDRADAGLRIPALGGDGRRRRLPDRPHLSADRAEPAAARRAARRRLPVDRGRRHARADPRQPQTGPGLLDDLPVRVRRRDLRHGVEVRPGRGRAVRPGARTREVRAVPGRGRRDRRDRAGEALGARRPRAPDAGARRCQRRGRRRRGGPAADARLLPGRAVLQGGNRSRDARGGRDRRRRGPDVHLHGAVLVGHLPRRQRRGVGPRRGPGTRRPGGGAGRAGAGRRVRRRAVRVACRRGGFRDAARRRRG